jgi:hypothetical protein
MPAREVSSFERDSTYRQLVEATRHWVLTNYLAHGQVPCRGVFFVYANGPVGMDWGNPPGPDNEDLQPLRYKRYRITIELEGH